MTSTGATIGLPGAAPPADRTIIRLGGALDFAAAPALRGRLIGVLHRGTSLLILDLSRVLSCDVSGLAVLIGTQRRARLPGSVMCLAAPSPRSRSSCARPAWTAASPSTRTSPAHSPHSGTDPQGHLLPHAWPGRARPPLRGSLPASEFWQRISPRHRIFSHPPRPVGNVLSCAPADKEIPIDVLLAGE
jgi:anti-sigma B factor antagonist